jgi:hypothetical protein
VKKSNGSFLILLALLGGSLAVLCRQAFLPGGVAWANDLPLGAMVESSSRLPGSLFGCWGDFYWLGGQNIAYQPNLTTLCMALLSQLHYLKFAVPLSMFFLGFGAWFFFRQLGFSRMACVLGGLGAGLNMHFFSNACWGLCNWEFCCGMIFLALGILVSPQVRPLWIKGVLAGLAVGVAVMDGVDVGAILSIYVGIFLAFHFLTAPEPPGRRLGHAALVGGLVVISAALISLSTISTLVSTQISGTVGESRKEAETEADKRAAWIFNSQFSLPKVETLRLIIPGLFGYRLQDYTTSTNPSTYYWGRVAQDPHIDELESGDPRVRATAATELRLPGEVVNIMAGNDAALRQQVVDRVLQVVPMQRRHTGSGDYAGVLVCLLAAFGLANAGRRAGSPYSAQERRAVWFWGGAALFSLLVAWGRHAFLYALIYHVPPISSFRNPIKYLHPLNMSLMILSGYGLEVMSRCYLAALPGRVEPFLRQLGAWWKRVSAFEKRWAVGCVIALAAAGAGFFILNSSQPGLAAYVEHSGFDATAAPQIARFCIGEVGWFVVYLALSIAVVFCIVGRLWAGRRAGWAWLFLSAIMICDLARADRPWVRYYNYKEKLSLNPVTAFLREKPWEHRVNSRVWPSPGGSYLTPELTGLCHWWLENDYPFNDIECLEIDQAPRMPALDSSYLGNFFAPANGDDFSPATRLWCLTNTRYLLAGADWEAKLNQHGEPRNSFRAVMRLDVVLKRGVTQYEDPGDITVQPNSNGPVALLEFTRALPRTRLYADWKIVDDATALRQLGSSEFDPEKTVLVAKDTPLASPPGNPEADPGTADISHYQSKDLLLEADAKTLAVLLLNDHVGDFWNVWVDHKPAAMLRCNYIMRGVFVPAGHHTVEFRYQPPLLRLFISLTAFALGILLAGYVIVTGCRREPEATAAPAAKPPPGKSKT